MPPVLTHSSAPCTCVDITKSECHGFNGGFSNCYDVKSGEKLYSCKVFKERVHGMRYFTPSSSEETQVDNIAIIWGQRDMRLVSTSRTSMKPLSEIVKLPDVVWCAVIVESVLPKLHVVASLAHNRVAIYDVTCETSTDDYYKYVLLPSHTFTNSIRCITYSSHLIGTNLSDIRVLSGTVFNEIHIWELPTTRTSSYVSPKMILKGHEGVIFSLASNPNNTMIASTSDDRTVRLWSSSTGDLLWTGWGHTSRVWSVAFANAEHVITSGEDGTVRVWSISSSQLVATLKGSRSSVWRVASSPTGDWVASGNNDGTVKIWNLDHHCKYNQAGGEFEYEELRFPELPVATKAMVDEVDERAEVEASGNAKDPNNNDVNETTKKKKKKNRRPKANALSMTGVAHLPSHPGAIVSLSTTGQLYFYRCGSDSKDLTSDPYNIILTDAAGAVPAHKSKASCFAVHPHLPLIAVGFSSGHVQIIVLNHSELEVSQLSPPVTIFHEQELYGVCSMFFMSADATSLYVGYVKNILLRFEIPTPTLSSPATELVPVVTAKLIIESRGVASCLQECPRIGTFVGDSRGAISFFAAATIIPQTHSTQTPLLPVTQKSIVRQHHGREVVSCLHYDALKNKLYSIGHDSTLRMSKLSPSGDLLPTLNVPVSFASALTHLYVLPSSSVVVGGFHASLFSLQDVTSGYQYMQLDAGGWKRPHDFSIQFTDSSSLESINLAIVNNSPNNLSSNSPTLNIYQDLSKGDDSISPGRTFGVPYHCRTVHCITSFRAQGDSPTTALLVSGSEDNTIKLCSYSVSSRSLTLIADLDTFSSCVRAIASSTSSSSSTALIIAGGGKLQVAYYRYNGPDDVTLLSNETPTSMKIDHRMNAIAAVPIDSNSHLVSTGDSNGTISLVYANEVVGPISTWKVGGMSSRPILSLDMVRLPGPSSRYLLCAGNTAGEIGIWLVTFSNSEATATCETIILHLYEAHQMGANDISLNVNEYSRLKIVSGGDDQALALFEATLGDARCTEIADVSIDRIENASSSAIKSVSLLDDGTVHAVGYDQHLTTWNSSNRKISESSQGPIVVNVTDVSSACLCEMDGVAVVAVVGDGIETITFAKESRGKKQDDMYATAADVLRSASHILLTCGAGMSADSGLDTYENLAEKYKTFCDPTTLTNRPKEFSAFWKGFSDKYETSQPHRGYECLESWLDPDSGKLPRLESSYCYTSNVDGMLRRLSCFSGGKNLCEIHGFAGQWRCAGATGKNEHGEERMGWKDWNSAAKGSCGATCSFEKATCCGVPIRPNVLMFNDSDATLLRDIEESRQKYQSWEAKVEEDVCASNKLLVILEIGCGLNVPTVRHEGAEVMKDTADGGGNVVMIRLNLKDECHIKGVDLEVGSDILEDSFMGIGGYTAEDALLKIDRHIQNAIDKEARALVFDDAWMETDGGTISTFGEVRDDQDVIEKRRREDAELDQGKNSMLRTVQVEIPRKDGGENNAGEDRTLDYDDEF